jgi:hypothetical protein
VFVDMRDASLGIALIDTSHLYPHVQSHHGCTVVFL